MPTQVYLVCEVAIGVECADSRQSADIDSLWRKILQLDSAPDQLSGRVHINLRLPQSSVQRPHVPEDELYHSSSICVSETQHGVFLRCGTSVLDVHVNDGEAKGALDNEFWTCSIRDQREFFLVALIALLRREGLYGLHANAVVKDGIGMVIAGQSGSGKTTTTLSLLNGGWSFLSDDAIMLRQASCDKVQALALRKGFSFTDTTTRYFPDLDSPGTDKIQLSDGKTLIDVDTIFSDKFAQSCIPHILVFPQIVERSRSELVPMDETGALLALIDQSVGIMSGKSWTAPQLEVLTILVSQARSYRMLAARDVYENPKVISDLIARTAVP